MESNQNQYLKGTVEWSQTENQNRKESNRNQELKRVARYQIENRNRNGIQPNPNIERESNRNQQLKGIKPSQTETNS
jgi:hypothetical protein